MSISSVWREQIGTPSFAVSTRLSVYKALRGAIMARSIDSHIACYFRLNQHRFSLCTPTLTGEYRVEDDLLLSIEVGTNHYFGLNGSLFTGGLARRTRGVPKF